MQTNQTGGADTLIFLDFDGVLNRFAAWTDDDGDDSGLHPGLVQRMGALVEATDAHVVLSTAWREHHSAAYLRELLHVRGLSRHRVIDTTPVLRRGTRGREIAQWLADYQQSVRFAVIDDNAEGRFDMTPVRSHLVQTNPRLGFTAQDRRRVERLLREGPRWSRN